MNPDQFRENLQKVPRDEVRVQLEPRADGLHLSGHTSGTLVFKRAGNVKRHRGGWATVPAGSRWTPLFTACENLSMPLRMLFLSPLRANRGAGAPILKAFSLRLVLNFGTD
jgi:hypothetical protein